MATYVTDTPFMSPATVTYPNGDNTVDPSRTAVVSDGSQKQTLTFNAAGQLLSASNLENV